MIRLMPYKKSPLAIAWFLLVVYINFLTSCSYYRVKTLDPLSQEAIVEQIQQKEKYIILHAGEEVWHLNGIVIDNDHQQILGSIEALPANHLYYKTAKPQSKANRYRRSDYKNAQDKPIHEIHIYTTAMETELNSQVNIPISSITKVEVYDTHTGATVGATAGLIAGGTIGAFAILAIIAFSMKSSCPFVYINDGETYAFTGEMYGGAIYPSLERDDYMPLEGIRPVDGLYSLKISNELLEKQYTNLAKLIIAHHPENTKVLIDKNGNVQTLSDPQTPITTITNAGTDDTQSIALKDSIHYSFHETGHEDDAVSSLIMTFKRPTNAISGKLVINAKNSYWLDYAYGKFNELFGIYYNTFAKQQKKEPASNLNQWSLEQHIPLSVYVETKNGWKFVDYFNSIGPLASRDIIMPIDLTEVTGQEVKIKLECGFMFWEVDYAAMDFSSPIPIEITSLNPTSAIDENGKNVSDLLSSTDNKYLEQPEIGNVVTLTYPASPPPAGRQQTVFLHSCGYYEYIRDYKNFPDISYLKTFKETGAFTRFAKERYRIFENNQDIFAAALTQPNEN